jgi:hypothetical protein
VAVVAIPMATARLGWSEGGALVSLYLRQGLRSIPYNHLLERLYTLGDEGRRQADHAVHKSN